jgi:hypothetical protein
VPTPSDSKFILWDATGILPRGTPFGSVYTPYPRLSILQTTWRWSWHSASLILIPLANLRLQNVHMAKIGKYIRPARCCRSAWLLQFCPRAYTRKHSMYCIDIAHSSSSICLQKYKYSEKVVLQGINIKHLLSTFSIPLI